MTTYPLATLAAQVSATGISAPSYDDVYQSLVASYQGLYGSDVVLTADTQDGQWLGVIAKVVTDVNAACIAVYNGFSPTYAQGTALSSLVKINGLARETATSSSCDVTIGGTAGTVITAGVVSDGTYEWQLPPSVTIPVGGSIIVTATCTTAGAVTAEIGTIIEIRTPTLGWFSVTNASAAALGSPVESDAGLRARQAVSTAISASSPMDAILAAVRNVSGVTRVNWDENSTNSTDGNSVPAHTIALVVEGGDATSIAQIIADTKTPGTGTYGSITEVVTDLYGIPSTIKFSAPTYERIIVDVSIHALNGYTVQIGDNVVSALQAYVAGLEIGESVYLTQMIAAAIQNSGGIGTFNLVSLTQAIYPGSPTAADITIAYNQAASLAAADITLSLV